MPVIYKVAVQFGSVRSVWKKYVFRFGSVWQIPGSVGNLSHRKQINRLRFDITFILGI
jgi:hypothetical protein